MGKSTINGPCSIAMLNYQRVIGNCWENHIKYIYIYLFFEESSHGTEFYPSETWGNPNMEHPIEIKSKLIQLRG